MHDQLYFRGVPNQTGESDKIKGKLIISFDCEGKWGIADRPQHRLDEITGLGLRQVYRQILAVLKTYEAKATFGIVAALCLDRHALKRKLGEISPLFFREVDWLGPVRRAVGVGSYDGWTHPELAEMIIEAGVHEICSHGGFHLPYDSNHTPEAAIDTDLALVLEVKDYLRVGFENFIYPRNVVGYKKKLSLAGFRGYRNIDRREQVGGARGKLERIAHEFSSGDLADVHARPEKRSFTELAPLSPGKFFNARIGIRKIVPNHFTVKRIAKFIEEVAREGGIAHFYTHPHNFISDPAMIQKLASVMNVATEFRDRGLLDIITMEEELNEKYARREI